MIKRTDTFALVELKKGLSQLDLPTDPILLEYLAQDTREKEQRFMKKTTVNYTEGPIGRVQVVSDFLPSPEELTFKEPQVKVTLSLSKSTLDFFKQQASSHHGKYQRMIRTLLDEYVAHYINSHAS